MVDLNQTTLFKISKVKVWFATQTWVKLGHERSKSWLRQDGYTFFKTLFFKFFQFKLITTILWHHMHFIWLHHSQKTRLLHNIVGFSENFDGSAAAAASASCNYCSLLTVKTRLRSVIHEDILEQNSTVNKLVKLQGF